MNTAPQPSNDAAADLFARRVAARMTQGTEDLPYDISERLRAARMQALAKRKVVASVRKAAPVVLHSGSTAILGRGSDGGWWNALVSAIPLMALVIGLFAINAAQTKMGSMKWQKWMQPCSPTTCPLRHMPIQGSCNF